MASKFFYEDDIFFNPELKVENLEKKALIEDVVQSYRLTIEQCKKLKNTFSNEMRMGLRLPDTSKNGPESKFPMFNSFVTKFPKPNKVGQFLGLDIGGTNMRIVHLELLQNKDNSKKVDHKFNVQFYDVPKEIRLSNTTEFFKFLTASLKKFLDSNDTIQNFIKETNKPISLGFAFSFGTEQTSINSGRVIAMGIQTNLSDIYGKCPVELFQKQIDSAKLPVRIVALANDCCTTLLYAMQLKHDTSGALILGSGTNISYVDKISNFSKYLNPPSESEFIIVVSEFCIYGEQGELDSFITKWDLELDRESLVPRSYVFEKLVGGAFQGELLRLTLIELAKAGFILHGKLTDKLMEKEIISTADMSAVEAEAMNIASGLGKGTNKEVIKILKRLNYREDQLEPEDVATVVYVCELITVRVALLTATSLSVFIDYLCQIKDGPIRFGCDGSYFKKHPKISTLINSFLKVLSPQRESEVFVADQGSGLGAAVLASCYD